MKLLAHAQPAITRLGGYSHAGKKEDVATNCNISWGISRHKKRQGTKDFLRVLLFFFRTEGDALISFHLKTFPGQQRETFHPHCWSTLHGAFPNILDKCSSLNTCIDQARIWNNFKAVKGRCILNPFPGQLEVQHIWGQRRRRFESGK